MQDLWLEYSVCPLALCLSFVIISMGYLDDYSPPFGEGPVGGSGFVAISFFFISCAYNYSMNILSFLIFFI